MKDRFLKRLRKKVKKGSRGWPVATIACYGPNLDRASKVVVSVIPTAESEPENIRSWTLETSDVRTDPDVVREMLDHIALHGALTVTMADGIIGCPHQEGIDYDGEWCPVCDFWHGRDRFTHELVH